MDIDGSLIIKLEIGQYFFYLFFISISSKKKMYHHELRNRKIISDSKNSCSSSIPSCFVTNKKQFTEYRNQFKELILLKLNSKFRDLLSGKYTLELKWNGEKNMQGNKVGDSWTLLNVPQILNNRITEELKMILPNMVIDEHDYSSIVTHNVNQNTIGISFCVELERITIVNSIVNIISNGFILFGLFTLLLFVLAIIGSIDHSILPRMIVNYNNPCGYISIPFINLPILQSLCKSFVCPILSGLSYNPVFINNCQQHFTTNI